ncbi:MAG: hypothetical protein ACRC0G_15935 [Fusobacteriaceae bacterium]
MKAYNARKMSKEKRTGAKGALRVSFFDKTMNLVMKKAVDYNGKWHTSCKKKGVVVEVRIVKGGKNGTKNIIR